MIGYNELFDIVRKEKYSEQLQTLPKKFIEEFKTFLEETTLQTPAKENTLFSDSIAKSQKQRENAMTLFRELMLRRKKKLLNLVFVATETGILKRDYENMLEVERQSFEAMTKTFEDADKQVAKLLNGQTNRQDLQHKMIIITQDIEEFMDTSGQPVGPFKSGQLASLASDIAQILVQDNRATYVDN